LTLQQVDRAQTELIQPINSGEKAMLSKVFIPAAAICLEV
jgi:hypothetical protein